MCCLKLKQVFFPQDKERALEMKNIYSNRPTHSSMDNSPDNSPSRKPKKKATSLTELTPRDKAKFYAEKRRAEVMKQKEVTSFNQCFFQMIFSREREDRLMRCLKEIMVLIILRFFFFYRVMFTL